MSKENVAEQQELEFETEVDVKEETEEAPQEAEAEAPTEEKKHQTMMSYLNIPRMFKIEYER